MDRKIVITVPRQHKNFLVAEAKNAKSHISRCLVTLLLDVVYYCYIFDTNSLNIRFEMGCLKFA